jgi:LPPG:FO 2-phospho-L-lactate transferase
VNGFSFAGEGAQPTPAVTAALERADLIVICPSNPFVSIGPILSLPGVKERVRAKGALAVSPIVGGQALKGPAGKMLAELGLDVSAAGVAHYYQGLLRGYVLDQVDAGQAEALRAEGLRVSVTDTIMRDTVGRARLARSVLGFAGY